ncbi:carboxypeptidase regulatory-like domain-containing protein [Hymenobacter ruricola]|uniref:Carboxypeptidase regulatory-like domain-containing protein n=1 Tax=Hymenobacter ruricola TaxID=2791023 RepID=A0ABS0I2F8_9BACT|nr:carboxypeptidase regulatory-like domain-containing protein [Hymenobacter ruricola]MBF9220956.1 carboxypeptidase regulatory-like domain-containing protein [Hymenobacter ruricola]
MRTAPRFRTYLSGLSLAFLTFATSCSRDAVAPSGAVVGALAPVAGVGSITAVTATAADGHTYTATPDAQGNFSFPTLPPGTYTLTFSTNTSTSSPWRIPVTVVAGSTTTAQVPVLTHDNVVRGKMSWTLNGTTYSATEFGGKFGPYLYLRGSYKAAGAPAQWNDVFLVIPEENKQGKIFAGPGTYPLGVSEAGAFAEFTTYPNGPLASFSRYVTYSVGAPVGTVTLTRYDAEQGIATGRFEFVADANANATGQVAVTNGSFEVTF